MLRFSLHCGLIVGILFSQISFAQSAKFTVEGLEHKKARENVSAYLQGLEAPLSGYSRFSQQVSENVIKAMQVYGFYHAEVSVVRDSEDQWQVNITPNEQTLLDQVEIKISGPASQQDSLIKIIKAAGLKPGQPLNHKAYTQLKQRIQTEAQTLGYFDFNWTTHEIRITLADKQADILLLADSGERYHFGDIRMPEEDIAVSLIEQLSPIQSGDVYNIEKLVRFNTLLRETGYFQRVLVRPLVSEAEQGEVPLEVSITHKPRDNFDVGGGISSDDDGLRGRFKWRRPWVNPYGHSMGADIYASKVEQAASFDYRIPLEDAAQNYASLQAGFQRLDDEDTLSEKFTLAVQRHWQPLDADWQRIGFVRVERESYVQANEPEQDSTLVIPGMTISRYRHQGGLDMTWGDRQTVTVEFASEAALSDIDMVRITAHSRWLRSFGDHRFLWRFEAGAIITSEIEQVPASLRFFTGGDQSVRGFRYRSVSPVDDEGELTGGRYLAVASTEYSYPVADDWRAALFIDVGDASVDFGKNLAVGAGFGAIWQSPVGPVRLYLARGKDDIDTYTRLHISMGPAL